MDEITQARALADHIAMWFLENNITTVRDVVRLSAMGHSAFMRGITAI